MITGKKYLSYTLATSILTVLSFAIITACSDRQAKAKANIITKPATKPGVVAKIGGEEITEEQLIGEDKMDFFELKKREYRSLWIVRINAAVREEGLTYSEFIHLLNQKGITLDRKILADLAMNEPESFKKLIASVK